MICEDEKYMQMAIDEANKAYGQTSPNPLVGAVAVKQGKVLGRGYHHQAGCAHAEVDCLKSDIDFQGATLYVTLEPCCTHGRTPPCTEKVIKSGIKRVVIGTLDPNPQHAGLAVGILEKAGIEVSWNILPDECWALNLAFFKWIQTGKPMVCLKMAMTLDGKIATAKGQSQWITGPAARHEVQSMRQWSDAIMVGGETIKLDNSSLRVQDEKWPCQPQRYIWSSRKNWDPALKVFQNDDGKKAQIAKPVTKEDWNKLLREMGENNYTSLLLEGGGELAANALKNGIVDKISFFIAPKILMGRNSRPVVGGESPESLEDALQLQNISHQSIGADLLIEGYLSNVWETPFNKK